MSRGLFHSHLWVIQNIINKLRTGDSVNWTQSNYEESIRSSQDLQWFTVLPKGYRNRYVMFQIRKSATWDVRGEYIGRWRYPHFESSDARVLHSLLPPREPYILRQRKCAWRSTHLYNQITIINNLERGTAQTEHLEYESKSIQRSEKPCNLSEHSSFWFFGARNHNGFQKHRRTSWLCDRDKLPVSE